MHVVRVTSDRPAGMSPGIPLADRPVKTAVPVAHRVVDRPRLRALLDDGLQAPATVIAATAGWGKTLLAASWFAAGPAAGASAWVSLDRGRRRACRVLAGAATALMPVAGDDAAAACAGWRPTRSGRDDLPATFAAAMRLADKPVVLVLDNLHEVRSAEVHEGLLRFDRAAAAYAVAAVSHPAGSAVAAHAAAAGRAADGGPGGGPRVPRRRGGGAVRAAARRPEPRPNSSGLSSAPRAGPPGCALSRCTCAAARTSTRRSARSPATTTAWPATWSARCSTSSRRSSSQFLQTISMVDLVNADLADTLTGATTAPRCSPSSRRRTCSCRPSDRPGRWYRLHRLIVDILRARPIAGSEAT